MSENQDSFAEYKIFLLSELKRINTSMDKGFNQINVEIRELKTDIESHIIERVEIPSEAIRLHEEICREEKGKMWEKINTVYNGQIINTTKLSVWSGGLSILVSLITALIVVYVRSVF